MVKSTTIRSIVHSRRFEQLAFFVILINAILTGIQVTENSSNIATVQYIILGFFVLELIARFMGRESNREYFTDGWNYFDVFVVGISFVPESMVGGTDISVLRTLRILRLFRILRQLEELRLITAVLLKSIRSLEYSGLLFLIFMYVYAVIGVSIFKANKFTSVVQWSGNPLSVDPYGSIGEAMFTLFRILTGEDWTDLRYNLLAQTPNLDVIVTLYHVSWMIISGFLLVNLVVGAVVNNYDRSMDEVKAEKEAEGKKLARRKDD